MIKFHYFACLVYLKKMPKNKLKFNDEVSGAVIVGEDGEMIPINEEASEDKIEVEEEVEEEVKVEEQNPSEKKKSKKRAKVSSRQQKKRSPPKVNYNLSSVKRIIVTDYAQQILEKCVKENVDFEGDFKTIIQSYIDEEPLTVNIDDFPRAAGRVDDEQVTLTKDSLEKGVYRKLNTKLIKQLKKRYSPVITTKSGKKRLKSVKVALPVIHEHEQSESESEEKEVIEQPKKIIRKKKVVKKPVRKPKKKPVIIYESESESESEESESEEEIFVKKKKPKRKPVKKSIKKPTKKSAKQRKPKYVEPESESEISDTDTDTDSDTDSDDEPFDIRKYAMRRSRS
eukprot:TRINITY_DN14241_c0_g1_i6.p2 TRINITY_DN14241_c0_g1~~TRINITY_DN14241_c0_g1_i6.p2  ORF type:complete len:341 (-),score=114.62 TRINITY_DN14241_c0_g1_i6:24-1046(-)